MNLQSMDGTSVLFFLVIGVAVFFIQVAILRWIFMIKMQVKNQESMIFLLKKLCENKGIDISALNVSEVKPETNIRRSAVEELLVGKSGE